MSSPAPFQSDMDSNPFVNMEVRPMRVKILYTSDDNKTNCLARFPDVLRIPTVPIDDNTHIGVIQLQQCIKAIVSASPELVSRLSQGDFTIYAYDYSEYETPQVGQGLLSSILAAASPTVPAHQSKGMITGRVCKNIMGIFSNGISETLEVKLRLVPVPRPIQDDYVRSMDNYRSLMPAMSGGFDPNAWSDSLALEPPFAHQSSLSGHSTSMNMFNSSHQHHRQMSNASIQGRPMSAQAHRGVSRPSSRASVRSENHVRHRDESFANNSVNQSQEDGPARKRAKVTQTDWKGRSSFGGNVDDLRVTASTAASIRVHKPVATRPGLQTNNSLEPPPRLPTPVPRGVGASGRTRPQAAGFARRESSLYNTQSVNSPDDPSGYAQSDAVMSSPEDMDFDQTIEGTPMEFPSSPPAMPEPSSPGLPMLPRAADSGYMSGGAFECLQDEEDRPIDEEDRRTAAQYKARPSTVRTDVFVEQTPGPPELLPTKMLLDPNAVQDAQSGRRSSILSSIKAHNSINQRASSLALPPRPEVPPTLTHSSSESTTTQLKTSGSVQNVPFPKPSTNRERSEDASPAPGEDAYSKLARSGSGAKRKKVIQDNLARAVASGAMPMFCANCGAIETPTWRTLHVKTVQGCPDDYVNPDPETATTTGIEVIDREKDSDKVTKYRIIKSMRKSRDRVQMHGYETMSVCNPCGLWFNKFKYMRPEDKWNSRPRAKKNRQVRNNGLQSDMVEPQSDYPQSGLWTDAMQPDDTNEETEKASEEPEDSDEPQMPPPPITNRPRASSMQGQSRRAVSQDQWDSATLEAALQRAIQSSPARLLGTQESPIELEDDPTPKPTRRLLFPSPRKDGEVKSLDDSCISMGQGKQLNSKDDTSVNDPFQIGTSATDKENLPPFDVDDDLAHLFEVSPSAYLKTPVKYTPQKTPTSKSMAQFEALLATPTPSRRNISGGSVTTRTPNRGLDPFLPTFSSSETRNLFPVTPSRNISNSITSPSPNREVMTPFTRQLTEFLNGSAKGDSQGLGMNFGLHVTSSSSRVGSGALFGTPDKHGFDFSDMPTFMTPGRDYGFDFTDLQPVETKPESQSAVAEVAESTEITEVAKVAKVTEVAESSGVEDVTMQEVST
ncbi:hypothetical protein MBLNU457_3908t1 [Dothideomycetes sp. NU457]